MGALFVGLFKILLGAVFGSLITNFLGSTFNSIEEWFGESWTLRLFGGISGAVLVALLGFLQPSTSQESDEVRDSLVSSDTFPSSRLKEYLNEQDSYQGLQALEYDGKAIINEHGVLLNHDSKGGSDISLGRSCDVQSYNGNRNKGEWAIGKYVWVVVFKTTKFAFTLESLPKGIDKGTIDRCRIILN